MMIYRLLTGEDNPEFCHRVSQALSEGWALHGSPSYAYDPMNKCMRCGQAVTRIVAEQAYDPARKLTEYR